MSDQQGLPRRALVVLGMHRSGTSAMTRVLGLCGAALPADPHDAGFDNPEGFWESDAVISLNEEILGASDSGWDDIFAGRPRRYLSNFDRVYRHKVAQAVATAFGDADLIVVKDPRINVLGSFWDGALRGAGYEPTYVVMVRHPLEVAASLRKRNKLPTETALLLWLDNMCAAERDTRGANRLFVAYEDLLGAWRTCVDRVEATAGVPLPRRTGAASNEVGRFLTHDLRHHRADPQADAELARTFPSVSEAYGWFLAAARGAEPPEAPALGRAEAYLTDMSAVVGPVVADFRAQLAEHRLHAGELERLAGGLRIEVESGAARVAETDARLEAAVGRVAETEGRLHAVGARAAEAEARLEAVEAERAELQRHADALEGERFRLQEALAEAEARGLEASAARQALEAELATARSDLDAGRAQADSLRERLQAEIVRLEAVEAERAGLGLRADALEAEHAGQQEALAEAQARMQATSAARRALEVELAAARSERDAGGAQADSLRERLQAEIVRLEAVEAERAGLGLRADALEAEHARQQEALAEAQARMQATSAARQALEVELAAARSERDAGGAQADVLRARLEADVARLEAEGALSRDEAQAAHRRAETADGERLVFQPVPSDIEGVLEAARAELRQVREAHAESEGQARHVAQRYGVLRAELERLQAASEATLVRANGAERELEATRSERDRLQAEAAHAAEKDRVRQAEIARLRDEAARDGEEIARLRGRAESAEHELESEAKVQIRRLLEEREAMVTSTSWRLTSAPRRLLSRFRRG